MSAYSEFFLSSPPVVAQLELLEITHPSFSETHRLVRNRVGGVTVTHEGPDGPYDYTDVPMAIKALGSGTDLDQSIEVTLGDLGEIIPAELSLIAAANTTQIKPLLKYRTYRSDDLDEPLFGPVSLRVDAIALNKEGATFKARAASFNVARTGETYNLLRFPMLRPLA
jgi:hypothetical protein